MGVPSERHLSSPWMTRAVPVFLAAVLVTGALGVVCHRQSAMAKSRSTPPSVDFLAGSFAPKPDTTVTTLTSVAAPSPTEPPATSARPAAPARQAAPWHPTHAQADYMGSTIAEHQNAFVAPGLPTILEAGTSGIDVSRWQGPIDWSAVAAQGIKFTYIKATEATTYTDPYFGSNYAGAANAGLIRGAYHFAVPNVSSGPAQANYFVDHGGGWTGDGHTLPPALDIEYNPYGSNPCYGLTPAQMTSWVSAFVTTVYDRTARWPVIYTTTDWWSMCTGNNPQAGAHSPLWLASWTNSGQVRNRPEGWSSYTIWQYADHGIAPGDQDFFHGTYAQLKEFAARPDRVESPSGSVAPGPAPVPATVPTIPGTQAPPTPVSPVLPSGPSTSAFPSSLRTAARSPVG